MYFICQIDEPIIPQIEYTVKPIILIIDLRDMYNECIMYLNIENLLKKKGKSKYWLVQELGSNYTVINNMIDNQTTGIRFDTMEKLCKLLECTPNDLFIIEE